MLARAQEAGSDLAPVTKENGDPIEPVEWLEASQAKLGAQLDLENQLVTAIVDRAVDLRSTADNAWRAFLLLTLVAIVASMALAFLVARAIARPLQKLTVAANRLSTEQLPSLVEQLRSPQIEEGLAAQTAAPIDIDSRDEIGQLADAFNTIQQVTLEVAEEQSSLLRKGIGDIFINLARRNQTLLDRQIEFIDQLEANEEDPDQLDNLFKLDHLATRMRRNAESLLVLAGAEPPRRRGRPVSLADVVRVAIGEVEDFARISLLALDDAQVGGNVAVDLAHLLSELMENATHFSPPDTHVEVLGRVEADGSYALSVTDQGIGMSPEQLGEANSLLENPPVVGLALSRSLGFIVVGRLAQRFGIRVDLQSAPSGGITAVVNLPRDLVTDESGAPLPIEPGYEGVEEYELVEEIVEVEEAEEPEAVEEYELVEEIVEVEEAEEPEAVEEYELVEEIVEVEEAEEPEAVEEYELVEEIVDVEEAEEPEAVEEYELVEEIVDVEEAEEPEAVEEPVSFDEVVSTGDAFDRGLESLISGETGTGPIETSAPSEPEPLREPEPVVARAESEPTAAMIDDRPPATPPPPGSDLTAAGLVKRTPKKQTASTVGGGPLRTAQPLQRPTPGQSTRSPEEVRKMLSRYRGGLKRGRVDIDQEPIE